MFDRIYRFTFYFKLPASSGTNAFDRWNRRTPGNPRVIPFWIACLKTIPFYVIFTYVRVNAVLQVLPETHVNRTGVRHAPGTRVLHGGKLRQWHGRRHVRGRTQAGRGLGRKPLEPLQ